MFSSNIFENKYMQVKINHVSNANRETKLQQIFQATKKKKSSYTHQVVPPRDAVTLWEWFHET